MFYEKFNKFDPLTVMEFSKKFMIYYQTFVSTNFLYTNYVTSFFRALQLFRGIFNSFKRQTHVKNKFRVMQGIQNDFCHLKYFWFQPAWNAWEILSLHKS